MALHRVAAASASQELSPSKHTPFAGSAGARAQGPGPTAAQRPRAPRAWYHDGALGLGALGGVFWSTWWVKFINFSRDVWVPTFCGVWYGRLADQRVGGYDPDRPRLALDRGGGYGPSASTAAAEPAAP